MQKLKKNDLKAIREFKTILLKQFPEAQIVLYGSKATGRDGEFSDIDLLILLDRPLDMRLEEKIFGIAFEVGLNFDVVLSVVVESKDFWNSPLAKVMPFAQNVAKEGVVL